MNKIFSIILLIFIFIFNSPVSIAHDELNHWTTKYTEVLQEKGVLRGFEDVEYDTEVTREEFAIILSSAFNVVSTDLTPKNFPDVLEDNIASKAISLVSARGWLLGYQDGKFYPKNNVTRTQVINAISLATETYIPFIPKWLPLKNVIANIILKGFYKDHLAIPIWARENIANASLRDMIILDGQLKGDRFYLRAKDYASLGEISSLIYLAVSQQQPSKFRTISKPDNTTLINIFNWYIFISFAAISGSGLLYFKNQFLKGLIYYLCKLSKNLYIFNNNKVLPILDMVSMCLIGGLLVMTFLQPTNPIQAFSSGLAWTSTFHSLLKDV